MSDTVTIHPRTLVTASQRGGDNSAISRVGDRACHSKPATFGVKVMSCEVTFPKSPTCTDRRARARPRSPRCWTGWGDDTCLPDPRNGITPAGPHARPAEGTLSKPACPQLLKALCGSKGKALIWGNILNFRNISDMVAPCQSEVALPLTSSSVLFGGPHSRP